MLFRAAEPDRRYQVLERFYRLGPDLIARFYAAQSRRTDQLRILSGRPPVPIGRAMRSLVAAPGGDRQPAAGAETWSRCDDSEPKRRRSRYCQVNAWG